MAYRVTLRDLAVADFEALDGDVRSPKLGKDLGHKIRDDST